MLPDSKIMAHYRRIGQAFCCKLPRAMRSFFNTAAEPLNVPRTKSISRSNNGSQCGEKACLRHVNEDGHRKMFVYQISASELLLCSRADRYVQDAITHW